MALTGLSLIGARRGGTGGAKFHAFNPVTGEPLEPVFHSASMEDVNAAVALGAEAFQTFRFTTGAERAAFLRAIASNIEALGPALTERVMAESALAEARVKGETARTCGQLRMFAGLAEEGSWVDARIDHADPARQPLPKPDVRSMLRPIGPVVVFGASNFPLAYSTAGGDTASALAAGCPVISKAHPAHPGTCEMIGDAVRAAVQSCGLPDGVFSQLFDRGHDAGTALVKHPDICGAGFTGSRNGGRALMDLAAARPRPIPVYAEMSSVNPVFLLPGALAERGEKIAAGLHSSVTAGTGQFCTSPGLVLYDQGSGFAAFRDAFLKHMQSATPGTMLTSGICQAYQKGLGRLASHPDVQKLSAIDAGSGQAGPAVFQTTVAAVLGDPSLMSEIFGPCTLLIACDGLDGMMRLVEALEGQLTASVHAANADAEAAGALLRILENRAGRLIWNGFPTGLEVCPAIVHGGPYPATSDGRSTSVGTAAIFRWARLVCWQECPDHVLPAALQEANSLKLHRLVDGRPSS